MKPHFAKEILFIIMALVKDIHKI